MRWICGTTLHHIAPHCNTLLRHTATHYCNTLLHAAHQCRWLCACTTCAPSHECSNRLQRVGCVAVCCSSVLQCVAVCCSSVLQCVAPCCNSVSHVSRAAILYSRATRLLKRDASAIERTYTYTQYIQYVIIDIYTCTMWHVYTIDIYTCTMWHVYKKDASLEAYIYIYIHVT